MNKHHKRETYRHCTTTYIATTRYVNLLWPDDEPRAYKSPHSDGKPIEKSGDALYTHTHTLCGPIICNELYEFREALQRKFGIMEDKSALYCKLTCIVCLVKFEFENV